MKGWNRVEDMCCVGCGVTLIDPAKSPLSMCTDCFKKAEVASKKQTVNHKNRKGMVKSYTVRFDERVLHPKFQR